MKLSFKLKFIFAITSTLSLLMTIYGVVISNAIFIFLGIIFILVNMMFYYIVYVIALYKQDKELDIEALKKQGLTIVRCSNCHKKNVLEDQYCIFCGTPLSNQDESV
ncbi:MAG: zinc ribbon domain-containing protein [Candidatus Izimaplasma sp.]|nr:zinc ribbon domain-containing protein [Candidatus Izimaplasma bacterium]